MAKDRAAERRRFNLEEAVDDLKTGKLHEKTIFRQPDTCWAWIMCVAGTVCNIVVLGCAYCFGIIFPSLLDEFKKGKSSTAWVGSMAMAAPGLFGPVSGRLTNHFGARVMVICGALLCAAGLLFTSLVPSLYLMFLTYGGIYGCGSSFVYIALFEIVPQYFVKHRSLATGMITMSVGAGLVVMSPVCQELLAEFGWRGMFRGLGCIVFIVFFLGLALNPNVASEETEESREDSEKSQALQRRGILDFSMWKNSTFVGLTIASFFIYAGHSIPPLHFARYCEELGIAKDLVVWLYSCIGLSSLFARLLGSKLCDVISPQRVFITFVVFSAVSSMLLPLATNWIRLLCFAIVYGVADGLMAIGGILTCIQTLSPKQKAQGFGFHQLLICTAFLCGPPIGGLVADKTSSYSVAFFTAGGIEFLGLFVFAVCFCLKRRAFSREKPEIDSNSSSLTELLVVEKITVL